MDDKRLTTINNEKNQAINNSNKVYDGLLQDNQNLYNEQNKYAEAWESTQNANLDKQLAFTEQKINQQKEDAKANFATESRKAENDYFAYSNPYGYQAEQFASQGLLNSGVSETAKLGGYNTYQKRLATANKTMQLAIREYDNDMNQARLTNDVTKAENATTKLQMQLEYLKNYTTNKNSLSQNKLSNSQSLNNDYFNRYQTIYGNIQAEQAAKLAQENWLKEYNEQIRQYNANLKYQKEKDKQAQANWQKEYELSKKNLATRSSGGGSRRSSSSKGSGSAPKILKDNKDTNKPSNKTFRWSADEKQNLSSVLSPEDFAKLALGGVQYAMDSTKRK